VVCRTSDHPPRECCRHSRCSRRWTLGVRLKRCTGWVPRSGRSFVIHYGHALGAFRQGGATRTATGELAHSGSSLVCRPLNRREPRTRVSARGAPPVERRTPALLRLHGRSGAKMCLQIRFGGSWHHRLPRGGACLNRSASPRPGPRRGERARRFDFRCGQVLRRRGMVAMHGRRSRRSSAKG